MRKDCIKNIKLKIVNEGQWFVAQLAKRSLPKPEIRGSNPVIGEVIIEHCFRSIVLKRRKEKEARMAHFKKKFNSLLANRTRASSK